MAVSLSKGGNISLTKTVPGLEEIIVGLGWDARSTDGAQFDLDAAAFLLSETGKVGSDLDFIFYGQKKSSDGSVEHMGDNRDGGGAGDDEQVKIHLGQLSAAVTKVAITVTIDEWEARRQNFGMVSNAFVRIVDAKTGTEIARFDLTEDASLNTAMVFGEIYRNDGGWKFKAVGQGFEGGLKPLATGYGVSVA